MLYHTQTLIWNGLKTLGLETMTLLEENIFSKLLNIGLGSDFGIWLQKQRQQKQK